MAKQYDSTLKELLAEFAADWVGWLGPRVGLPATARVEAVDADVSTVQLAADKVFKLIQPAGGLLHIEPQVSWDGDLPDRLHIYNALLKRRHGGPVYTVALLLRREANASSIIGELTDRYHSGEVYQNFKYQIVRVWELPVEPLLSGNIGALPLALLTDEATGHLRELVNRMDDRLRSEQTEESARNLLLTSGYILSGLRYNDEEIHQAFKGVMGMKESTTYQAILKEGRQEGTVIARQDDLLEILRERFSDVSQDVEKSIRSVSDGRRLQEALRRAIRIASITEFEI